MTGQPCVTCGSPIRALTSGFVWCPDCGTLVQDRGRELELISVPRWADPEALAELYTSIIQHREMINQILDEIATQPGGTVPRVLMITIVRRLQAIAGAREPDPEVPPEWREVSKRSEDATIEEMRMAHDAAEGGDS